MTPDDFRERWIDDRPLYERFAADCEQRLRSGLATLGIPCNVAARAKDVPNLLTKVIRKGYTAYEQVTDKAGARIVTWYPDNVPVIDQLIRSSFDVHGFEDKALSLRPDQFGYAGKHYEARLPTDYPETDFLGLSCEIQLHSRAQNLWSDVAHDLTYKPALDVPGEIQRTVNRLVALVELFDDQLVAVQHALRRLPDFQEAAMLFELEKTYYRFVARSYDREMSLHVLGILKSLYTLSELERFSIITLAFANAHREKFTTLYSAYETDQRCSPFLFQPECIAIFERLENDEFRLREAWDQYLPAEYLTEIAVIWGRDIE